MNIHSLRLLQTELQPCIHDKKNYVGSGHSYEFSRATQRFPNPARTSYWHNRTSLNHFSGNVDYDPWTCEMILGTAYQYIYPFHSVLRK